VHNLLYVFYPNALGFEKDFDTYYPGDAYVDILGVDIFNHDGNEEFAQNVKFNPEILKIKAGINNKPYTLVKVEM
jgi:mannan endo-1,4-beta-mannosidase